MKFERTPAAEFLHVCAKTRMWLGIISGICIVGFWCIAAGCCVVGLLAFLVSRG